MNIEQKGVLMRLQKESSVLPFVRVYTEPRYRRDKRDGANGRASFACFGYEPATVALFQSDGHDGTRRRDDGLLVHICTPEIRRGRVEGEEKRGGRAEKILIDEILRKRINTFFDLVSFGLTLSYDSKVAKQFTAKFQVITFFSLFLFS